MKSFIGIDWGHKKVGTSFGNDETCIAFAGELMENNKKIFDNLIAFAHKHDASTFVVGTTEHAKQKDNTEHVDEFIQIMESKSALRIARVEEMFSTSEAQENLKAAGKKDLAKYDDVEAARILLQSHLEKLKQSDTVQISK